jgi:hypothetical protein
MAEHTRRPTSERIAEIDAKIEAHKKNIATLEARKKAILTPKTRRTALSMNAVIKKAKEQGYTAKDIARKLNISFDD